MAQITPPPGFTAHFGFPPDVAEIHEVVAASNREEYGKVRRSADILGAMLAMPAIDAENDIVSVRSQTGELVAFGTVEHSEPYVQAMLRAAVHPAYLEHGIGSAILSWSLERVEKRITLAPEGTRVIASTSANEDYAPATALLGDFGFELVRYFLEMEVRFTNPPPHRDMPAGIDVATFDRTKDMADISAAIADAFRDHFGYTETSPEEELAQWETWSATESWDDSLVWIARAAGEAVGGLAALEETAEDPEIGYIAVLGVRKAWRGRGLAKALLSLAFEELFTRGRTGVSLHVDADSLTGATRLYESVGMDPVRRSASFHREMRAGTDAVVG